MAVRRKVLTGRNQRIPIGGTELSKLGVGIDSDELVESLTAKMRAPSVEPLSRPEKAAHKARLANLGAREKELIMKTLGRKGECSPVALSQYLSMDSGLRDLRTRKFLDSIWTNGAWKEQVADGQFRGSMFVSRAPLIEAELNEWNAAAKRLQDALELEQPTQAARLAALEPSELSEAHKRFIRLLPMKDSRAISAADVEEFRTWILSLKQAERDSLWRVAEPDVVTLATLLHRISYIKKLDFNSDEIHLLRSLFGDEGIPDLTLLKKGFLTGFRKDDEWKFLSQQIRPLVWTRPDEGILASARACAEYRTLLDFLDIKHDDSSAKLFPDRGFVKASKNTEGNHSTNDDTCASLEIMHGAKIMRLDAVFDGISGHNGGYIASGIAKETFEISAMAGWIASPEDARLVLIVADMVVNMEKERYSHKRMGTTASIAFKDGLNLYAVTCGDSPLKVVREGKVIFSSNHHVMAGSLASGLGIGPQLIDINNSGKTSFAPIQLKSGDWTLVLTDGLGDVTCDHEYGIVLEGVRNSRKAALGLISVVDKRRDRHSTYKPLCGCEPIEGKDDDIAIIANYIE
jgi:hypothetical protein